MKLNFPQPTIINSTANLNKHVDQWASEPLITLDTESNSLHAYYEQVCLIQLSTREADFIIDPLLVEDLTALGSLLSDPAIEIVFHAAEYDLMCLKRDYGFTFNNLFDTMLAARICGAKRLGLASMLEDFFQIKANKKYQRANWGERPLTAEMLQYAQLDTHFLPQLRDHWRQKLIEMGRWEEAQEDFMQLAYTPAAEHTFNPDGFWRINGANKLEPQELATLRELYLFREDTAERRDSPPFKVLSDRTLLAIALNQPGSSHDLRELEGMSHGQVRRYGRDILQAIKRGKQARPPRRPKSPSRPSEAVVARFEALRQWRKRRARKRGVESDIIVSKGALWALARLDPDTTDELADIRELGPWKAQTYGDEIIAVIEDTNDNNGHE